jgi:hypothetical protein
MLGKFKKKYKCVWYRRARTEYNCEENGLLVGKVYSVGVSRNSMSHQIEINETEYTVCMIMNEFW